MDKVMGQAGKGIQESAQGLGDILSAPFAKKAGDKKEEKETKESAAPVIINIINQAKGDEDKGASASASAVAGPWKQ
jgi:hypothetical protein